MLSRIKTLFKPKLKTLNTIFISKTKILNNLEQLKTLQPKSAFFPVLKANAYGYGILPMLEILKGQDFPYLAVDSFPEYQLIHKHSQFKTLIIGETHAENYRHFDHKRTAFAIYNLSTLQELENLKRPISIHLFLNTGMNREGIQIEHLGAFLAFLKEKKQINLEGVMSHLHSADTDKESIKTQIAQFKTMTAIIEKNGFSPKRKHLGASAGLGIIQDDFFTAWRPGIALYGYAPSENRAENIKLQPALRLESTIISLQSLASGEGVSYNQKRKTDQYCRIATIPFGYYEGWLRSASGKLNYGYQGECFPQLGTICMNLSSCIANEAMQVGDTIELISDLPDAKNSIERIAHCSGTIPYEVLIRLDKGIRRVVVA